MIEYNVKRRQITVNLVDHVLKSNNFWPLCNAVYRGQFAIR